MASSRRAPAGLVVALAAASLLSCAPADEVGVAPAAVERLLPNERGTLYASAADEENALLGISLNDPHSFHWAQMSDDAVKVSHGLVHLVRPNGETQWPWFPYRDFIAFERAEVAAGRPPLLLTATYEGRSRPVYFNWSLGFPAAGEPPPVTDRSAWERAVDIGDDRYTTWLVENYVDPVVLQQYFTADGRPTDLDQPYPNEWLGMDEIAINYQLYGVLDDAGNWVPMDAGPVMDSPFPNGSAALHSMFQHFFQRLHEVRPGLRVMANPGSPDTWVSFAQDFADVDGLLVEEAFDSLGRSDVHRASLMDRWSSIATYAAGGGVVLVRSLLDPAAPSYETDLRSGLMAYLMLSGTNTAWAPQVPGHVELDPSAYEAMRAAVGRPTSGLEIQARGEEHGALYTRRTEHGVAYVNATGQDVTVPCPAGATCRDRAGVVVDGLTLPDLTGDYLLTSG